MFISRVIFSIMLCLHMYLNEYLPSKIKTKQLLMVRVHLSRWYQFLPYEGRTRERGGRAELEEWSALLPSRYQTEDRRHGSENQGRRGRGWDPL